jgi:lipopolysaccharide export LptBFGC system permease protein LptF
MVTTLDRYIARQFGLNYVISFSVLVSLYIVLDLFFNLDEFYQDTSLGFLEIAIAVGKYYAAHLFWYFSQISGVITLFAMAFTLARLQRDNEFVAIISSGVSMYRMALTVIVLGVALNGLWLVDQELIIPRLAQLQSLITSRACSAMSWSSPLRRISSTKPSWPIGRRGNRPRQTAPAPGTWIAVNGCPSYQVTTAAMTPSEHDWRRFRARPGPMRSPCANRLNG